MRIAGIRFLRVHRAAIVLLFALIHAPLAAQGALGWTLKSTFGPTARVEHAVAYDSLRGSTVLFGGFNGGHFGDTWEWNGASGSWTLSTVVGPGLRRSLAMVYDSSRGRTVLFGGIANPSVFGDTWEWDGTTWTQVATTGPASRAFHTMAYDSQRGRTVLFGGQNTALVPVVFGDTWEWDGTTWTQVAATGPTARVNSAMAYDSQRGRTVLFSGYDFASLPNSDTWEWDGSTWRQVAATGPTGRSMHTMAYDSQRGKTVVFGGWSGFTIPSYLGDTWEWNGTTWTQAATTGPTGHRGAAMAYDSQRGRTVLFGGWDTTTGPNGPILGDTWEWSGPLVSAATTFGTGCGGPALLLSQLANARPTIGTTAQAALTNIPSLLAFVAVGWSNTTFGPVALPLTLAPYGMPGCHLLQSAEAAAIPTTATGPGTAIFSWSLPNWSGLIGLHVYLQGWASAPGANTANVIVSNGVEWVIGNT